VDVPITLIVPDGVKPSATTPLMVYAYGEYGDPAIAGWLNRGYFEPLLKRGVVIAYAHVRGGFDKGLSWQKAGSAPE